jgi:hypothetical protein
MKPLKIFIGYDAKETVAFHTLAQSIMLRSTSPVAIIPVNLQNLSTAYKRSHDNRQSNEFSFSRFLVPYLCDYDGIALFMDCDMLVRCDITKLFESVDPTKAVSVVQHKYESKVEKKYLGNKQYHYPRKNWSSVIVWNAAHPKNKIVTPDFVANEDAATLHRFLWLEDDEIGNLGKEWNWLVGEYDEDGTDVKIVHWTLGGPYFNEYQDVAYSDEWRNVKKTVNYCAQMNCEGINNKIEE